MIRPLIILTISFTFLFCNSPQKKLEPKKEKQISMIDIMEPDIDTLPNGIRLLDNVDSGMTLYYKQVVGSDTLMGEYITCYGIDDSAYYFYLRHGDSLVLLNKTPSYTPVWSLGILEKDFNKFFITQIDNGNGVPNTYQVFEKKSGKNLLGDRVKAWNYKYMKDTLFFIYDNHTVTLIGNYIDRKDADSIFLYNVNTNKREGFKLPKEKPEDVIYYEIKNITNKLLTLTRREHYTEEETLITYSR